MLIACAFAGLQGCSQKKEAGDGSAVVAEVGSRTITLDQLEEKYRTVPEMFKPREEGLEGLRKFLDTMIQKELVAQAAEDSIGGLDERQRMRLDRRTDNIVYEVVQAEEVRPDLEVGDAEIEELYERRKIGYRPRHILVKSLGEANEVMRLLSEGAVFEALAMQMSIDRNTYREGGDMGLILPGDVPPELDEALSDMKVGETVGPIKTDYGYHILRLEDQREVQAPPLDDDLRERLKLMILSRRSLESKKEFLDKVKEEIGVKYHTQAVRMIDRRFTELWDNKQFLEDPASIGSPGESAADWFPEFAEEDGDLPLMTIADSTITLGAWIDKMRYAPAIVWPKGGGDEWIRQHLDDTYYKDILIAYGEKKGMRDDPEVLKKRDLSREEILVNTFYRTRIDTVHAPTEAEALRYYEENVAHYSLPDDLVQASLLIFNEEEAAKEALERWGSGEDINMVYKDYKEAGTLKEWQPNEKLIKSTAEPELFNLCWELEAGEYFGPVAIFGDHIIGQVEGKSEAGPIPWLYARQRVHDDLKTHLTEKRLQEVMDELREKYKVTVHEDVLARSELVKEQAS